MHEVILSVSIDIGTSSSQVCGAYLGALRNFNSSAGVNPACGKSPLRSDFYGLTPAPLCGSPVVEVSICTK